VAGAGRRLGQRPGLGGRELEHDGALVDRGDVVGVGESHPAGPAERVDHDAVEDVLALVGEHVLDRADRDPVASEHLGPRRERQVGDRVAVVHGAENSLDPGARGA
jgi:hypothetical protein